MSDITWVKLKTKMFDDEKIQLIEAMPEADTILIIWIKLLIQAGKTNNNGDILLAPNIPYSIEMLSTIFRRTLQSVKFALKILSDFDMIEVTNSNVISIKNWAKHQNIEGLDKIKEQNRLRQAKFREDKKAKIEQKQINSNVTVTLSNETDIDIEKDIKKKNIKTFSEQSPEVELSKLLFNLILNNNPIAKQPNFQSWAKHIDLMIRIDNRSIDDIKGAIIFSQQDSFWHTNILSTEKLRKQFDQLLLKARNNGNGKNNQIREEVGSITGQFFDAVD